LTSSDLAAQYRETVPKLGYKVKEYADAKGTANYLEMNGTRVLYAIHFGDSFEIQQRKRRGMHLGEKMATLPGKVILSRDFPDDKARKKRKKEIEKQVARERQRTVVQMILSDWGV
jgi:hypothetical protein